MKAEKRLHSDSAPQLDSDAKGGQWVRAGEGLAVCTNRLGATCPGTRALGSDEGQISALES